MGKIRKASAILLTLVFLTSLVLLPHSIVKAQSKTIIVPDDYLTIQSAINHADSGDIVFVRAGTYSINDSSMLDIRKPISVIGENPSNTIIVQQPTSYYSVTIRVNAPDVTISGFTFNELVGDRYTAIVIGSSYAGGYVPNCKITNNRFVNGEEAIKVEWGANFIIANNDISRCSSRAIYITRGINGTIINNDLSQTGREAVNWYSGSNLLLSNNTIRNNAEGLILSHCNQVYINKNNIIDNKGTGITLLGSCNNVTVRGNYIAGNGIGFALGSFPLPASGLFWVSNIGDDNFVFKNNFSNNSQQVSIGQSDGNTYGVDLVAWDFGNEGNYWSDYNGNGSYVIDENNIDHYPLSQQVDIGSEAPTPMDTLFTPLSIGIIIISVIAFLISVVLFRRHRKTLKI